MLLKIAKRKNKLTSVRSSGSQKFFKIGVLKNFMKFTGNTCAGVSSCNFSKKRLKHKCFPVNTAKNLKVTFFTPPVEFLFRYI